MAIIIICIVLVALEARRVRQLRRLAARLAALEQAWEPSAEADKQAALYTAGLSNILGYGGPLGDRKERVE